MFIQLRDGSTLSNHQQLDQLIKQNPTTIKTGTETGRHVIRYIKSVRIEWETSGNPLDSTTVTVKQMLDEFTNMLADLGLESEVVSTYTVRED